MTAFHSTAEYATTEAPQVGINLSCDGATFSATGQAAVGQASLLANVRALALTGIAALTATAVTALVASFSMGAQAATMPSVISMETADFVLGRGDADMTWETPALSYSVGAQALLLRTDIDAETRAFSFALQTAQAIMPVDTLALSLEGQDAIGYGASALDEYTFSLFGRPLFPVYIIGLDVPGEPATAEYGTAEFPRSVTYGVMAETRNYIYTAQDALLVTSPRWVSYVLTRYAAQQIWGTDDTLSYALNGQSTLNLVNLPAETRELVLTGSDIDLLTVDPASFDLNVNDAALRDSLFARAFVLTPQVAYDVRWMAAAKGTFTLASAINMVVRQDMSAANFTWIGWAVGDFVGPSGEHTYLIEVHAHNGTEEIIFYLSTEGFTSQPYDNPPNQYYDPRVIDPGNFERSLFDGSQLRGRSRVSGGDIIIANGDPGNGAVLDDWFNYGWSQRDIRIKSLPYGANSLSLASTLFVGKIDTISSTNPMEQFSLKISDRLADLEQPLITELFAGTTLAVGATAEGNADLAGKIKQECWGACFNVPLQPVNPYSSIYQVSRKAVFSIVLYDGGLALTNAGDTANLAALHASTVAAGSYRTCLAEGRLKIGALPSKQLTADVVEGATAADRTAGQIAYRMLIAFGIPSGIISTGSIAALDALNPAECGYFVADNRIAINAIQDVLDSVGAWMMPDRDGTLVFGRFGEPASSPQSIYDPEVSVLGDSFSQVDAELPVWRVLLEYAPVFSVQTDVSESVSEERRGYLAKEYRTIIQENAAVQTKHKKAREITVRTYLVDPAAALAEAARLLTLHSTERKRYDISMVLADGWPNIPGASVKLRHPRLGMAAGKSFNVLRRVDTYANDTIQMSIWG